jgi:hypothetical protein
MYDEELSDEMLQDFRDRMALIRDKFGTLAKMTDRGVNVVTVSLTRQEQDTIIRALTAKIALRKTVQK